MADGSPEDRAGPKQMHELTFSAPDPSCGDIKKCNGLTLDRDKVKLSFFTELDKSESCEKSETLGVAANHTAAVAAPNSQKTAGSNVEEGDDRKKRCFDRYDSSESSDSGVAVLSPTESSGCSGSDITEPRSPRSPESGCSTSEESAGVRMPPWASDPAPPAPRRLAAQPAPVRRPNPPVHRRITEYFNHKMKPQNSLKRDSNSVNNDDTKKKCLPKNGVTQDLEKYISYLSQTLSPKVLIDVGKQAQAMHKPLSQMTSIDPKPTDLSKPPSNANADSVFEYCRPKESKEVHTMNGFVEVRQVTEKINKDKLSCGILNGLVENKKIEREKRLAFDPSAKIKPNLNKQNINNSQNNKVPIPGSHEMFGVRIAPATSMNQNRNKVSTLKTEAKINGTVSYTTKLDSRMNGVTRGSNNLNLVNKPIAAKKETVKKANLAPKRTNRKSSACIANSKNLTWSKANNLKQVQLQKQNCVNSVSSTTLRNMPGEANTAPKMNIPNGVRQMSMTVNGNLNSLNVPVNNLQNGHQINVQQPCNGTVTSTNLSTFMAVPQNVMLTTLRIPQNGLTAQTLNQQGSIATLNQQGSIGTLNQQGNITFNRPNVNVTSPTKINGQFVFPLVQNINGTVVQIPNLMAKVPNFVLPQTQPLTAQRQNHMQNQQTQILINGTLLKLSNAIPSSFPPGNKTNPVSSQPISVLNKGFPAIQTAMTPQKSNHFNVNLNHPMLVPQPGFIVTSVPNVKETWSYSTVNTACLSHSTYTNPIVQHPPPIVPTFNTQTLHTSSIPIAPVKPPDNPIQGTEPPSSTVKETDLIELKNQKCDIPWLSKNVNNNIVPLDSKKFTSRPFAEVSSGKLDDLMSDKVTDSEAIAASTNKSSRKENVPEEIKMEEVSRSEETVFTQITVLKDVSSNVESTVIEANFNSATTESSESGIGTDKSIDSPSDSQGSKECDEDSSLLSLSVSVSSMDATSQSESQKSPILKQPKTLRFPPKNLTKSDSDRRTSSSDTTTTVSVCQWENCKLEFDSDSSLLEHLQSVHVETQVGKQNYVCLWQQCKVRGKPSCSRLWLERHTLSHGGNKPFKCIVDGCDRRFSTQTLLERHVNNHFNESSQSSGTGRKSSDSSSKLIRRNGKKLRYRRQPWSARMFDFFDSGMMEGLAWRLSRCTRWRLGGACPLREPPGRHTLTLHAALTATRAAPGGRREALMTYYPPNVIEDEWVPEEEVKQIKRVEISQLPVHTKVVLYEQFCSSYKKTPSPPPVRKTPAIQAQPSRLLPLRQCTSSRLLNNLLAKQKSLEVKNDCNATNLPMVYREEDRSDRSEVSGAKKRKLGRRHGGNAFWPSGR
ncbi:myb-like protein U isoform X1 [Colias croceus]|uniref:myb-like protein U isoform X1 n=1 Tax=Colias crocea TaxID=72248 RepID=UPI001E27B930|nr:myb-like protein U isoform X1 [Colias croceus]